MNQADTPARNHAHHTPSGAAVAEATSPGCLPCTRPPTYPTSSKSWINSLLEKENVHDTSVRRFVADEMRDAPVLGHRIARKGGGPLFPGNSYGAPSLLEELESMLVYIECVTTSLSHRTRVPIPPDNMRITCSPLANSRRESVTHYALAMGLRDSSNNLLGCFSELEYVSPSQSEMPVDIEKRVNATASDVNIALDAIEQRYRSHEVEDVREFFVGNQQTLEECRRCVREMLQTAQQILALRVIVKERNVAHAKKLLMEYHKGYGQKGVARLHSSFFAWMEKRWILAMETWNRIVASAHEQIETADVSSVMLQRKREIFSQSSLISELLHPGETLCDFVREQLERPLTLSANSFKKRRDCLEALRTAMATPNVKKLTEHVRALEELAAASEIKASADRKLLKEGKRLIICLQQVENMEAALRLATQVGETVTLFRSIHHANEILLHLGIAGDVEANREIVAHSTALLAEMGNLKGISPVEFVAKRVDVGYITVPHIPSQVWSTETMAVYQAACQCLALRTAQDLVRFDLERVFKNGDSSFVNMTENTSADEASNASSTNLSMRFARTLSHQPKLKPGSLEELRAALKRAKDVGLSCQLVQDGEAYICSVEVLKLKIHFEAQLRVLLVQNPEHATFEDIYKKVHDLCMEQTAILPRPSGQKLRLRYQDKDGDCISLVTQEDWNAFMAEEAPNGVCGSKLELFCDFPPVPHAHVTDEVLRTSPESEERSLFSDKAIPATPATSATSATPAASAGPTKDTNTQSKLSPIVLQRRDGAAVNSPMNAVRTARSRSAGCALRSPDFSPRLRTPGRKMPDGLLLQKPHVMQAPSAVSAEGARARLVRKLPVATKPMRRGGAEQTPPRSNTPVQNGRCLVHAVKVAPSVSETPRRLVPVRGETKPSAIAKGVGARPSHPRAPSTAAVVAVPPSSGPLGVTPVKRWNDDELQLELQTVASVASTAPRPVISISKAKLSAKDGAVKPHSPLLTSRPKSGNTTGKAPSSGAGVPAAVGTQSASGVIVLEEKREWQAEMFMQGDLCTVASETTMVSPLAEESKKERRQPGASTSPGQPTHGVSTPPQPPAVVSPIPESTKEKTELLERLRHLREENQKALKAATNQRRAWK